MDLCACFQVYDFVIFNNVERQPCSTQCCRNHGQIPQLFMKKEKKNVRTPRCVKTLALGS
jgi:hypothetical protein